MRFETTTPHLRSASGDDLTRNITVNNRKPLRREGTTVYHPIQGLAYQSYPYSQLSLTLVPLMVFVVVLAP